VVKVGVRNDRRIEILYCAKVRREGASTVGPYASVYQHPCSTEVEKVTATANLTGSAKARNERVGRGLV